MKDRSRYLIKNTGVLAIGNFSSKILVFLLVRLYTSFLSTEDYGNYELISTTVQLLMPILTLDIYEGAMRYIMDEAKSKNQIVSIGFRLVSIGILLFSIALIVNVVFGFWRIASEYTVFIFFYFVFGLLNQYAIQLAKGFERIKTIAFSGLLGTLLVVGCNILFLVVFKLGLRGFFLAYIFGYAFPAAYIYYDLKVFRFFTRNIDKSLQSEMIHFSAPLIFNNLGWWVNSASDRYIVTWICGVSVNGIYSVSYKIPSILNILQGIFIQAWQVSAIKEYDSEDSALFYARALKTINVLMSIACVILIALTIPLAKLLFAKDFFDAWVYVPFLLLSSVINAASGVLGPILSAKKESKAMGKAALLGAATNIVLNIFLIIYIGAQGAAIATAISSLVIYVCRYRSAKDEISHSSLYKMYISWAMIAVQSILVICTHKYVFQLIVPILFFVIFFKEIKEILADGKTLLIKKTENQ